MFLISCLVLLFYIILPIVFALSPLQFSQSRYEDQYEQSRLVILPLAIIGTLFGTIRSDDYREARNLKIRFTLGLAVLSFFLLLFAAIAFLGSGMCAWTDRQLLFVKRSDPAIQVRLRDFGCGATDSGSPLVEVFRISKVTPWFRWVQHFDTTHMDRSEWVRATESGP